MFKTASALSEALPLADNECTATYSFKDNPAYSGLVTHLELAVFSATAYRSKTLHDEVIQPGAYITDKRLQWWHAMQQQGWEVFDSVEGDDGFRAIAYRHKDRKQIVIAFRGTEPDEKVTLFQDWEEVCKANIGSHGRQAHHFTHNIQERLGNDLMKVGVFDDTKYQITFTGHSLGAWIASVACAMFYYPGVVFDNPGASHAIDKYDKEQGIVRTSTVNLKRYPLINYQAMPNLINTAHRQIGQVFQLTTTADRRADSGLSLGEIGYTLNQHSIELLVEAFNPMTGMPSSSAQMKEADNWPYGGAEAAKELADLLPESLKDSAHLFFRWWFGQTISYKDWASLVSTLIGDKPSLASQSKEGLLTRMTKAFEKAYLIHNYDYMQFKDKSPQSAEEVFEQRFKWHYQVKAADLQSMDVVFLHDNMKMVLNNVMIRKAGGQSLPKACLYLSDVKLGPESSRGREVMRVSPSSGLTAFEVKQRLTKDMLLLEKFFDEEARKSFKEVKPSSDSAQVNLSKYGIPNPVQRFISREAPLHNLQARFEAAPFGMPAILALCAPGGYGKTQLAIEFARQAYQSKSYSAVMWIKAGDDIDSAYRAFAERLLDRSLEKETLTTIRQAVADNLSHTHESVLFVFDSVDSYDVIRPYMDELPLTSKVHVLLTARNQALADTYEAMPLHTFCESEAIAYIRAHLNKSVSKEAALALSHLVDGHPLSLSYLVSYIRRHNLSLAEFQAQYQQQRFALLEQSMKEYPNPEQRKQGEAILFTLTDLAKENRLARGILEACSFVGTETISKALLKAYLGDTLPEKVMDDALEALKRYSFISASSEELSYFSTHRFLQKIVRYQLSEQVSMTYRLHWSGLFTDELEGYAESLESENTSDDRKAYLKQAFVHANVLAEHLVVEDNSKNEVKARYAYFLFNIAGCYDWHTVYETASSHYQQALKIFKAVYVENHPDVAMTLNNLAVVFDKQGQYDKALEHYNQALTIYKAVYGENHSLVAMTLNNLGLVFDRQGHYDKALEYYNQALKIFKAVYGENHPDVAMTLNNLAVVFNEQGYYDKALKHYNQALRIRKAVYGENHPSVAATLNNLGLVFYEQGQYDKALEHYNQALTIYKAVYEDNHPDMADTLNNLAVVFNKQGYYDKALEHYNQAWVIYKAAYGENHPKVATTLNNLAGVFDKQGQYDKALEHYNQTLTIYKAVYEDNHPDIAITLNNLGLVFYKQGQYDKAKTHFQNALSIALVNYEETYPVVIRYKKNLAETSDSMLTWSARKFDEFFRFPGAAATLVDIPDTMLNLDDNSAWVRRLTTRKEVISFQVHIEKPDKESMGFIEHPRSQQLNYLYQYEANKFNSKQQPASLLMVSEATRLQPSPVLYIKMMLSLMLDPWNWLLAFEGLNGFSYLFNDMVETVSGMALPNSMTTTLVPPVSEIEAIADQQPSTCKVVFFNGALSTIPPTPALACYDDAIVTYVFAKVSGETALLQTNHTAPVASSIETDTYTLSECRPGLLYDTPVLYCEGEQTTIVSHATQTPPQTLERTTELLMLGVVGMQLVKNTGSWLYNIYQSWNTVVAVEDYEKQQQQLSGVKIQYQRLGEVLSELTLSVKLKVYHWLRFEYEELGFDIADWERGLLDNVLLESDEVTVIQQRLKSAEVECQALEVVGCSTSLSTDGTSSSETGYQTSATLPEIPITAAAMQYGGVLFASNQAAAGMPINTLPKQFEHSQVISAPQPVVAPGCL